MSIQFFRELMKGRLLGHPIHAMLVHFPSALFPIALLFDFLAFFLHNTLYALIAFYLLGLGVIMGVVAACFGALDYFSLAPQHKAWKIASLHALLNVVWLIIFATLFGVTAVDYPHIKVPTLIPIIINALTVLGLIISNYLGGELVFHYHVGSKKEGK